MKKMQTSDAGDKITTIKISMNTRDELAKRGTMDDNYDTVIKRLLELTKEQHKE
jgi:hypothetical protein